MRRDRPNFFVSFCLFRFVNSQQVARPSIAASRRTCPHRSRRRTRVYHTGKRDACGISPRTTRGRWALAGPPGKSAENQLCGPRVFSRGLRNSLKSLRNKSVLLFWFRWLFSTSSRPPSFSRSEAHPSPAARCLSCSDNRSLPSGLPTVRACRWLTSLRATNRARVPMEIDELDANVIVVDDDLQAEWLKLVPGQVQALPEAAPWQGLSIVCCT